MALRPLLSRAAAAAAAWSGGPSLGRAAVKTSGLIPVPSPLPQVGKGAALMPRAFPKGPPAGACGTTLSSNAPIAGNTNGFLSDALIQKHPGSTPTLSWTAGTLGKPPLTTKAAPLSMAPLAGVRRPALVADTTLAGNVLPKALHKAPSAGKSPVLGVSGFSWIAGSAGKPSITSSSAIFSTRLKSNRTAARAVRRATYYTSSGPEPSGRKVLAAACLFVGGLVLLKKYGPVPEPCIPDDYIFVEHTDIGEDYEDDDLPENVDWSALGVTPAVVGYDDFGVGVCWAICSIEAAQSANAIFNEDFTPLSLQEIIECAPPLPWPYLRDCHGQGPNVARGQRPYLALRYMKGRGVTSSEAYPVNYSVGPCKSEGKEKVLFLDGWEYVEATIKDFKQALQISPIIVSVYASYAFMNHLGDDIMEHDKFESTKDVNHCVLLVGYGTDDKGNRYWKIQNNWGTEWGKEGFGLLRRGKAGRPLGVAGITQMPGIRPIVRSKAIVE